MLNQSVSLIAAIMCCAAPLISQAQSIPQPDGYDGLTLSSPASPRPYDFAILGVKPGMPAEEAIALIEEHLGVELTPLDGNLQVTSSDGRAFRTALRFGYETPGINHFMLSQNEQPYDNVELDISTPAIGSVVTAIRRTVRMPDNVGPDAAALEAQLTGLYGSPPARPSGMPGGKSWKWALDQDYAPVTEVRMDNPLWSDVCEFNMPSYGRYEFELDASLGPDRTCGVSYIAEHYVQRASTISMSFQLVDYNLMVLDHDAANEQIENVLRQDVKPSDLKL